MTLIHRMYCWISEEKKNEAYCDLWTEKQKLLLQIVDRYNFVDIIHETKLNLSFFNSNFLYITIFYFPDSKNSLFEFCSFIKHSYEN